MGTLSIILPVAGVLVAVPAAMFLAVLLSWLRRAVVHPAPPTSIGTLLLIAAREVAAQLRILSWTLLRRGSGLERSAVPDQNNTAVLLLHGVLADGSSMWHLRKALHHLGRQTRAPYLGAMLRPMSSYVARLASALEQGARHHVVVYPLETSRVEGAEAHEFDLVGHAELLMDARVTNLVVEALR